MASLSHNKFKMIELTHLGLNNWPLFWGYVERIFFNENKNEFKLKFLWNLFLRLQLIITIVQEFDTDDYKSLPDPLLATVPNVT